MPHRMTIVEMERTYPKEWVVIADCSRDATEAILDGVVIAHAHTREELQPLVATFPRQVAIWYMGNPLEGFDGFVGLRWCRWRPHSSALKTGSSTSRS
jgi:hypothetical protein